MTAQELDSILSQRGLTGGYSMDRDKYVIPGKMRYALVLSLNDPSLAEQTSGVPFWMHYETQTSIHPHHFLSTKDATNPVHNLQVGVKLTYLLNGKVGKKRFCPMCNDEFVPHKYKKKCVICKD